MHAVNHVKLGQALVSEFSVSQELRYHTDRFAAAHKTASATVPIMPTWPALEDQPKTVFGHPPAEILCGGTECGLFNRCAAENADGFYGWIRHCGCYRVIVDLPVRRHLTEQEKPRISKAIKLEFDLKPERCLDEPEIGMDWLPVRLFYDCHRRSSSWATEWRRKDGEYLTIAGGCVSCHTDFRNKVSAFRWRRCDLDAFRQILCAQHNPQQSTGSATGRTPILFEPCEWQKSERGALFPCLSIYVLYADNRA